MITCPLQSQSSEPLILTMVREALDVFEGTQPSQPTTGQVSVIMYRTTTSRFSAQDEPFVYTVG